MTDRILKGGIIAAYRDRLPIHPDVEAIHINEGNTPLVHLPALSDRNRNIVVYAKCEGLNPTGSFKDRGMTVALSMALHSGSKAVICASTGNTSASAAAYAARAGICLLYTSPSPRD